MDSETGGNDPSLNGQLAKYMGYESMKKIFEARILISGLSGLGSEIAKNLILEGVRSVTLHDTESVEMSDLSSHFCLTENDIGKNRAKVCRSQLAKLNSSVAVNFVSEPLNADMIKNHSAVVLANRSMEDQLRIAKITRYNLC